MKGRAIMQRACLVNIVNCYILIHKYLCSLAKFLVVSKPYRNFSIDLAVILASTRPSRCLYPHNIYVYKYKVYIGLSNINMFIILVGMLSLA